MNKPKPTWREREERRAAAREERKARVKDLVERLVASAQPKRPVHEH